ncbi:DNA starvation/stationary phase protection protein [Streptomyces sp. CC224B]|uniref:Dps family protein n=1 Tax=Streptomyces sp. CC224B TaxID=3044571 RepID=UPI0024A9AF37|nr:DNA starvation/stationary phase protection protein [Streptomyces sp. CC224B]
MTVVRNTLSDLARNATGEALQHTLVDLLGLSLLAKQAHWNVVGPRFRTVHLHLDEVVDTARAYADTIAERAAAIGVPPDGRSETVAANALLPAVEEGWLRDSDAVRLLTEALGAVIDRLRERITTTKEVDPVTQDLLISLTGALEKHHWMFQAEDR